ncbi:hypothetical protein ACU045_03905 [Microbacterium sp. MAHUQ-60]|uniref:hypothetical protein n=1 Tax=unclassified Microbacterium TaxID=2609290 RepID=UPI00360BCCCB
MTSIDRHSLKGWVIEALRQLGGSGSIVQVCQRVWQMHEADLRGSGELFYTWQYDIRWAAQYLRNTGRLKAVHGDRRSAWELSEDGWSVDVSTVGAERGRAEKK